MKIKNSPYVNLFGEGNQKEITTDDGKTYIVKNTPYKNLFGGGHQQIIEEKKDDSWFFEVPLLGKLFAFLFLLSCPAFLVSLITGEILKIGICLLITMGLGIGFMMTSFGRRGVYLDVFIFSLKLEGLLLAGFVGMILFFVGFLWLINIVAGVLA